MDAPVKIQNNVSQNEETKSTAIEEFAKNGMKHIINATKAVSSLPFGSTRDLYSAHPIFSKVMGQQSDNILNVMQSMLSFQEIKHNVKNCDNDEKFEILQDYNDSALEKVNSNLDELAGMRKKAPILLTEIKTTSIPKQYQLSASFDSPSNVQKAKLTTAKNIPRPQVNFTRPVDNSNNPFVPILKDKPNSLKPLSILPEYDEDGNITSYLHPYQFEIEKFEPQDDRLIIKSVETTSDIANAEFTFVDSIDKLNDMLEKLRMSKEIGVDLEHHSYRTFQGITCLMQLSTRKEDFIIDTIALRDELHILNEFFTDPKIVKIFHGADSDVEWLQRDLSLYLVNLFDTHQAARRLGFSRLSLAFLLKHYCDIDADKTFQLADWRMRPLPEQFLKYAQQDTHYLPFIFDRMTNDLIEAANQQTNLLKTVYMDSKIICLKRYTKPVFTIDSYKEIYLKSKKMFNERQLTALKEIFAWRDKIARLEDESYSYVLPNHMLLHIADTLPREMQGILACCNPIPPLVRQQLNNIHQIVLKARDQPMIKALSVDNNSLRPVVSNNQKKELFNHPLYCPHDVNHLREINDNLPTLLGERNFQQKIETITEEVQLSVFNNNLQFNNQLCKKETQLFISPYQRYKLMIPFMEERRKAEMIIEEEKRREKLNEKRLQLPELQVVKIASSEVATTPLKDIRKEESVFVKTDNLKANRKHPYNRYKKKNDSTIQATENQSKISEISQEINNLRKKINNATKIEEACNSKSDDVSSFNYSQVNNYQRFKASKPEPQKHLKDDKKKFKTGNRNKNNINKLFNFSNFRLNKNVLIFISYMSLFIAQGIFVTASQEKNYTYKYDTVTLVFLTEALKLFVSSVLYCREHTFKSLLLNIVKGSKLFALYFLPAFLYCLYNNLAFHNLSVFDPTTYYLLLQFRVVITGILFQIVFKKYLSRNQWLSLFLLTLGCMIKQVNFGDMPVITETQNVNQPQKNLVGIDLSINAIFIFIQVICSCLAGVYNEYLLKGKGQDVNIYIQNIFMYIDSIICNGLLLLVQGNILNAFSGDNLIEIFKPGVILIAINNCCIGIVTSFFLKYMNSILKTFASAFELLFTAILCWILFSIPIYINTFLAITIVSFAAYLYSMTPVVNIGKHSTDNVTHAKYFNKSSEDLSEEEENLLVMEKV
ncbi:CLUMA_CG014038, isoform A [Clunio marinus]|uniref:Exosome complex component 10 homolog n=1 Tax=Clunio marinus TaxID=568069 RepID=A0A1J1IKT1_9DIPT|nr:CLUMA_CG014038, isoform A [Clunio marinus]